MAEKKDIFLTAEGLDKLRKELEYLKFEKREEVIEKLKEARALGDLSENAEYDSARNEQAQVESRIADIEAKIENATIIKAVKTDKVRIGTNVKIEYVEDKELEEYSIVGSSEADPFNNKISNESPIAKAIMGLMIGQTAKVESPSGKYLVKIVEIS